MTKRPYNIAVWASVVGGPLVFFVEGRQASKGLRLPFVARVAPVIPPPTTDHVLLSTRGGEQEAELTLDEKVHRAMRKLGLEPPDEADYKDAEDILSSTTKSAAATMERQSTPPPPPPPKTSVSASVDVSGGDECKDGVCPMPERPGQGSTTATLVGSVPSNSGDVNSSVVANTPPKRSKDPYEMANRLASELNVDTTLAWAALSATSTDDGAKDRQYHEQAAREMIRYELDMVNSIPQDSAPVHQLEAEGFDTFLARRALAFAEGNMDDARAILVADQMDQEEEEEEEKHVRQTPASAQPTFKTVNVAKGFDPSAIGSQQAQQAATKSPLAVDGSKPTPARKEDVIFEATTAQIQEVVLESPVPVLLDVYADWCGPCKALSPALEEMAVKAGGAFRLVKVNSDNERPVAAALEVTALPTVFGVNNGRILNMFQGMPRSQEALQSFMMGLIGGESHFSPRVSESDKQKYTELSGKLVKVAGAACFSFSARERLQDRVSTRMDELALQSENLADAEEAAKVIRSLFSNVIKNPYETKYRKVNLANKVVAAKVAKYPAAVAMLKSVGFAMDVGETLVMGKNKKVVNVAPLMVARDSIDKWIDKTRYEVATAQRKRKDDQARQQLLEEKAAAGEEKDEYDEEEEEEEEAVDPNACTLKVRIDGKKRVHEFSMDADDKLKKLLKKAAIRIEEGEIAKITCAAKRLIVTSDDKTSMKKTFRELGLMPAASLVIAIEKNVQDGDDTERSLSASKLRERAAAKTKKTGTHTMQSVGIYSSEDNAKGELIDGGGGTWYEHDVSDEDEPEPAAAGDTSEPKADTATSGDNEIEENASVARDGDVDDDEDEEVDYDDDEL